MTREANPTRRSRKRSVLIGLAAGAVVLVGGAGVAVATGQFDREPDLSAVAGAPIVASAGGSDSTTNGTTSNGVTTGALPADAAALNAAIAAAVAAAGGVGAESVEVDRGGYDVDVQLADGSDQSAFVAADGTVRVSTERDAADSRPDPLLSADAVENVVDAVTGFAPAAAISSLSTSTDRGHAYEVDARQSDGVELELEIADDMTVTAEDIDLPDED